MILQEKTDRLHHLSIVNEELERSMMEKEQNSLNLTCLIKDLELQVESNIKEKEDNEKRQNQLKEEINILLQKNKSQNDHIESLREKLNEFEHNYSNSNELSLKAETEQVNKLQRINEELEIQINEQAQDVLSLNVAIKDLETLNESGQKYKIENEKVLKF